MTNEDILAPDEQNEQLRIETVQTQYRWYSHSNLFCPSCGSQSLKKWEPQGAMIFTPNSGIADDHFVCIDCGKFISMFIRDANGDTDKQTLDGLRLIIPK